MNGGAPARPADTARLAARWAQQPAWTVLDTGFGEGLAPFHFIFIDQRLQRFTQHHFFAGDIKIDDAAAHARTLGYVGDSGFQQPAFGDGFQRCCNELRFALIFDVGPRHNFPFAGWTYVQVNG